MAENAVKVSVAQAVFGGPRTTISAGTVIFDRAAHPEASEPRDIEADPRLKACGAIRVGFEAPYENYSGGIFDD
jgi:hypothetical protein